MNARDTRLRLILILISLCIAAIYSTAQVRMYTEYELGGTDNGVVGKIDDAIEVTPTGQLSYEIPIQLIPGTSGMAPSISLCYNSSTKNGIAGYGFDLSGLSIISRVPSDLLHDGISTSISFSSRDHFALDGQRLIEYGMSGSDTIEYRTEVNTFSKILAYGKKINPISFRVHTKSGLIYDYVSVAHALNKAQNDSTLFWVVSKVSDTKGNYFTVTYEGDSETNDFRPSRIDYTRNDISGLSPYASVRFTYISNPYPPITYVNGATVRNSKLLSSAYIYSGNRIARRIQLSYKISNRKYQLSKINEINSQGYHKNATQFTWTNLDDFSVKNHNYTTLNAINKAHLTVGDFNGDGLADFLATPEDNKAGWDGWKLFISRGDYFDMVAEGSWQWENDILEQIICDDFNGDGYADIVVKRCHSNKWHNCDLYLTSVSGGQIGISYSDCFLSLDQDYTIQPAELNGDGAADIFASKSKSKECMLVCSSSDDKSVTPLRNTLIRQCDANWDKVVYGDFNGDGLTDVMNLVEDGYHIMYSDGYGTMARHESAEWPNKYHYLELGDFNGDGKTDIILTGWEKDPNKDGWSDWCICYSKGNGEFVREYHPRPFNAKSKQLYIADFNGDGYDDIQAVDKTSAGNNMTKPQAFLNDGIGNFYRQLDGGNIYALDKWRFYTGDFNGDGKMDFLCTSDWNKSNWNGYQLYLMPDTKNCLLTAIKDGLGNTTEIDYEYLSNKNVFTRGNTDSYPLISTGLTWPVVCSVSTPDGIGGVDATAYRYENAMLHKRGRGILGFEKVHVTDKTMNSSIIKEFAVNTDKYVMAPKRTSTTVNGKNVSEIEYTYKLKTDYASSYDSRIYTYAPETEHSKTYEYNSGEVTEDSKTSYEYDSYGNMLKIIVSDGEVETVTSNQYTSNPTKWLLGRMTRSTLTISNTNGTIMRSSTFGYDAESGLLTSECFLPTNNRLGYKKIYTHDLFGNIIRSEIIPLDDTPGRATESSYDSKGRFLISATNSLGFKESFEYDDATGHIKGGVDINGITTVYSYGKSDEIVSLSTPISSSLKTVGWAAGLAEAPDYALYFEWHKDTGGPAVIDFFDCRGRAIRTITESVGGKKVCTDRKYNKKGLIERLSEPYFYGDQQYWTVYEYDEMGRTIKQTTPDGSVHTYDYNGLSTVVTDPYGHTSTKVCNLNGWLISSTDNAGASVEYEYDAEGKCVECRSPRSTILCSYDAAGNRVYFEDSDTGISEETYNAYGDMVSHKDSNGETIYTYDNAGRIVDEFRPDMVLTTYYDETRKGTVSEVVSVGDICSSESYSYDEYGRLITKRISIDTNDYYIIYSYDNNNHISTVEYPNKIKIKNEYDECGMLLSVSDTKTGKTYWRILNINARGQALDEEFGNGLVTTTSYNLENGNIAAILTPGIQDWEYVFDKVGNMIQRKDVKRGLTETFMYDEMYRLAITAKGNNITENITYDNAGNIRRKTSVGNYAYEDGTNRLAAINNASVFKRLKSWSIAYNSYNKVEKAAVGKYVLTLSYGPKGSRVMSILDGVRKYYVDNIFEHETDDRVTDYRCYIFAHGKAVAMISSDWKDNDRSIMYFHHDHLGSVQCITDESGNLIQELSYDAWGARRDPSTWGAYDTQVMSQAKNVHGFGGHEHIDLFELINMDGRIYDPIVGRFISPDPFVQAPDFTQGLNRYAYCLNNPLSLVDPSGYSWFSRHWKSLTASVVGIAVSALTLGSGTSIGAVIVAGVAGSAAGALTGTLLNGANIGQIAKSTFTGAFWGGIGSLANFASGDGSVYERLFKHSFSQGMIEGLQGGNVVHGFVSGATACLGSTVANNTYMPKTVKLIYSSALSGNSDRSTEK